MMLLPTGSDNRRFLLSLGVALGVHLVIVVAVSTVPGRGNEREREYQLLQVTLYSAPAENTPTPDTGGGLVQQEPAPEAPEPGPAAERNTAAPQPPPEPADTVAPQPPPEPKPVEPSQAPAPVEPSPAPAQKTPTPDTGGEPEPQPAPARTAAPEPQTAPQRAGGSTAESPPDSRPPNNTLPRSTPPAVPSAGRTPGMAGSEGRRDQGVASRNTLPTLEPARYVAPEYPEAARRAGVSGTVVVELAIGRRGRVDEAELIESSGHDALDAAAIRAVRLWRFSRREVGERSIHRFEFRLE